MVKYQQRAEYLEAIEKDYADNGDRAYQLVLKLANFYAKEIEENLA